MSTDVAIVRIVPIAPVVMSPGLKRDERDKNIRIGG